MYQAEPMPYQDEGDSELEDNEGREEGMFSSHQNEPGVLLCTYPGCLKEFSTRWSLNRHTRVHTGVKPYKCNFCQKEFAQNCSLKRHEQTHTQERQWVCEHPNCGKRFKLKEYLDVHHQRSHLREDYFEPVVVETTEIVEVSTKDSDAVIEQLRERLVRMSVRHHDQLYFHQEREQQLVTALQECSRSLERALQIITNISGDQPAAIPNDLMEVAQKYGSRKRPIRELFSGADNIQQRPSSYH